MDSKIFILILLLILLIPILVMIILKDFVIFAGAGKPDNLNILYERYNHTYKISDDRTINYFYFDDFSEHGDSGKTVLFCHGNSHNIFEHLLLVGVFKAAKVNLLMFDYEGYGLSKGKTTHMSIREDGLIMYDLLAKNTNDIIVIGQSLGGYIATTIASQRDCKKLVLVSTFSSIDDATKSRLFFLFASPFVESITNNMQNKVLITKVKCPVLIMHSINDNYIPFSCAIKLYNSCKTEKTLVAIDGEHSHPYFGKYELSVLMDFLEIGNKYDIIKIILKFNNLYK